MIRPEATRNPEVARNARQPLGFALDVGMGRMCSPPLFRWLRKAPSRPLGSGGLWVGPVTPSGAPFVGFLFVFSALREKNTSPRKIPPLSDYRKGRSGASAPFPSGQTGREEKMVLCAKWGVDARCGMRYDVARPPFCITASPSITRNLENFTIRTALLRVRSAHAPVRVS